ncbi:hypothetical protein RKD54_001384 [Pseudarthrobacter sp. SLBN-100]
MRRLNHPTRSRAVAAPGNKLAADVDLDAGSRITPG